MDSDADGLKDWQEQLFRLDPNNPDTDGDGILDGQEYFNDESNITVVAGGAEDQTELEDDGAKNISQKFFEDAVTGYMALRSTGLDDSAIFEILLAKYQDEYASAKLLPDTYSSKEVITVADSPDEIRKYANNVAEIFGSDFENFNKSEAELLDAVSKSDSMDPELLSLFGEHETAYNSAASRLKLVLVPSSYVSFHTDLVNDFQNLAIINGAFKNLASDPLAGVFYISSYKKESKRLQDILAGIAGQILKDNISFSSGEIGQAFLSYSAGSN